MLNKFIKINFQHQQRGPGWSPDRKQIFLA